MFGYVNCDKPNMLMKDYTVYKAYYCGLCKSIGKYDSLRMRFTINFDITFLSILAHNLNKVKPTFLREHCFIHPVGKKFLVASNDEIQEKIVYINTLLAYYKVYDDVLDSKSAKHKVIKSLITKSYKKAKAKMPKLDKEIGENYSKLRAIEKDGGSLDSLADCFGKLLENVICGVVEKVDDNLRQMMYNLGRWIYIIDAVDDFKKDVEQNNFNPFLLEYKKDEIEKIAEVGRFNLLMSVNKIKEAYNNMGITISEGALSNVIYVGLNTQTNKVLNRLLDICPVEKYD